MEYIQQVSVHIAAARLADAKTLIDELEAHRRELQGMRGFLGMQISRSPEPGGDARISIETRWRDEGALDEYAGLTRNAESIIGENAGVTVPDTLEVRRMEALAAAEEAKGSVVYERFASSLVVPAGIFILGLAIIYALSRVYLEMGGNGAIALAVVVAIGVLLLGWYFAVNPKVPVWHLGGVAVVIVSLLIGGTVYAQVHEGPVFEKYAEGEPTPAPGEPTPAGTPGVPGALTLEMHDNYFTFAGSEEENPTIEVAASTDVTISLPNVGKATHNLHIAGSGGYAATVCRTGGDDPCSDPASIGGGKSGQMTFNLPAGSYDYRCDFHPDQMLGTVEVS